MPRLAAHRANQFAGWIHVPEHQGFAWVLRLTVTPRISVTLPIRVHTQDKGWTQYFFAELDGLAAWQIEAMIANNLFDPVQAAA